MTSAWLDELTRFTQVLDQSQQALLSVLRQRRQTLQNATVLELERFNEAGRQAAQRLQVLGAWRQRLIADAQRDGDRGNTLVEILATEVTPTTETLRGRLLLLQRRFAEVQREAWIEWVVTQRSSAYYGEVLELIAHGGKTSPVYTDQPLSSTSSTGGVMLDAAA
ncbi:MAG: hypothetical protein Q8K78_00570 [Planctomycetaceae bacterium]|nr:hypothetical protein [Planctomycetaceae bacterium]